MSDKDREAWLDVMSAEPRLLRRPLWHPNQEAPWYIGFDSKTWADAIV